MIFAQIEQATRAVSWAADISIALAILIGILLTTAYGSFRIIKAAGAFINTIYGDYKEEKATEREEIKTRIEEEREVRREWERGLQKDIAGFAKDVQGMHEAFDNAVGSLTTRIERNERAIEEMARRNG